MPENSTVEQHKYICNKLNKVMRKVQRFYEAKLSSFGITPVQFVVLASLLKNDGMKFKDLAENIDMDGSTLTGILDRLERAGYVERKGDPEDRRSVLIFLTEKANESGPALLKTAEEFDEEIKEHFTPDEFDVFIRVLDKITEL